MKVNLRSLMPGHISGQIAIIIVVSVLLIHVVLTTAFFLTRRGPPPQAARDELATLVELIAATPAPARTALVTQMRGTFPRFDLALANQDPPKAQAAKIDRGPDRDFEASGLAHRLGPDYHVDIATDAAADPTASHHIAVRFKDGTIVTALLSPMPPPPALGSPFMITLMAIALTVTLLGFWAAWGLVEPAAPFRLGGREFRSERRDRAVAGARSL